MSRLAVTTALVVAAPLGGAPAALAASQDTRGTTAIRPFAPGLDPSTDSSTVGSSDKALEARLAAAIKRAVGDRAQDVSVTLHDRRSNTVVQHNPSLRNCTGSIVKALVLVGLVRDRREDGRRLSDYDRSLARRMITTSDNDATSTLLGRLGGASALQRVANDLGMTHTRITGSWGRSQTTAPDQARLIDAIVDGDAFTDRDDQAYVLDLMGKVVPEQAWGVGTVPEEADVALKNGWVPLSPRGWRVNSIGHVSAPGRDYTLTMLSYDNDTMDQGVTVLDRVSTAVYQALRPASTSTTNGLVQVPIARPAGAPDWLMRPGMAFPPYPAW